MVTLCSSLCWPPVTRSGSGGGGGDREGSSRSNPASRHPCPARQRAATRAAAVLVCGPGRRATAAAGTGRPFRRSATRSVPSQHSALLTAPTDARAPPLAARCLDTVAMVTGAAAGGRSGGAATRSPPAGGSTRLFPARRPRARARSFPSSRPPA